jgi:OmpA-OmpF porin, OOP family
MEKHLNARTLLWASLAAFFLTGAFTVWIGPHATYRLESRIEAAARTALADGGFDWATAEAQGQKIVLEGVAPSEAAKAAASKAALTALGPGGFFAGGVSKVASRQVEIGPLAKPFVFSASKEIGAVTLEGVAPSRSALVAIEDAGRALFGDEMTSRLTLATGAPKEVNWPLAAIQGMEALQTLERGSAQLKDSTLTVSGVAPSEEAATQITDKLAAPAGGVTAVADVIGPTEWYARFEGSKVSFTGKIGSGDKRRALQLAVGRDVRLDDQSYVSPVGDWQARALAAVPHLLKFRRGEIAIQAKNFRISGLAPSSELTFLREDMAAINDGYTVIYNVTETAPTIGEIGSKEIVPGDDKREACQTAFSRVMAANTIRFGSANAVIGRESGDVLDKLISIARQCEGLKIEIQGHTDSSGSKSANLRLSQQRAQAVRTYFEAHGIKSSQLSSKGYGSANPVASNRTESGRAQNRRIEFKVTGGETR